MSDEPRQSAEDTIAPTATEATSAAAADAAGPDAIAALLARHGLPGLQSIDPIGERADEPAFLVNGELIVRLDGRGPPAGRLAKVALIYGRLRRATDVPCPEMLVLDRSRELLPYDALVMRRPRGRPAADVWTGLDEETREALSEEVGRMVGAAHALGWDGYGDFDPATGSFGPYGRWVDMLLGCLVRAAEDAAATGALPRPVIDSVVTELNDGDSVLATASRPVLAHGDLHAGNILIERREQRWHVSGIFGWASALAADAAWEFATLGFGRSEQDLMSGAVLYGYRERHQVPVDLRSRIHLYRLLLHLEAAVAAQRDLDLPLRLRHETILRKMIGDWLI